MGSSPRSPRAAFRTPRISFCVLPMQRPFFQPESAPKISLFSRPFAKTSGRDSQRLLAGYTATGLDSLLLHYPPYYGADNLLKSLRLFAEAVIPAFRTPAGSTEAAE